ncbi:hypothetical protein Sjap_002765 [Stephania japonica]|uniref:Uncharacterized protein n=1 Tax=Stephania japonica TaxID=461633 RepID=A0AAP0KND9_9MAGN
MSIRLLALISSDLVYWGLIRVSGRTFSNWNLGQLHCTTTRWNNNVDIARGDDSPSSEGD